MIKLQITEPHWINDSPDDSQDQCSHGRIQFSVNSVIYVNNEDGDWTTSASGLFLLRTVEEDHTKENPVSGDNFLIPCCGFSIWPTDNIRYPCSVVGCNTGLDIEVRHENTKVHLKMNEKKSIFDNRDWAIAVLGFVEQVESFYGNCSPKVIIEDDLDRKGWRTFWNEWRQRKEKIGIFLK